MRSYKMLLLILASLLAGSCFSQSFDKGKLDQYLKALETNKKFMGHVMIYQHGKKIYSNAVGFSNVEEGRKADSQTMYRIGSVSKTITAGLVLRAMEEGKIRFSDKLSSFFPTIDHSDLITIGHLLNHHSGIHNFTGGNFANWSSNPISRRDLIDSIAKGGSDFSPGTKAAYSNSNYVLLSFILEDIYQMPYAEILQKLITQPLGLKLFLFGDSEIDPGKRTLSYTFEAGWKIAEATDLSIPMGAGAVVSSAEDLAKVLAAIFQGKIISGASLAKMEEQADGYGYGIFEQSILGKTAYMHDGAIDAFHSYYYYFPKDETLYVLLSNAENYRLETVNETILSIVFNKSVDLPVFKNYTLKADDLRQYAGTYSSKSSPLVIDISVKNDYLMAQPQGQGIYTMEAIGKGLFQHEKSGVTLEFDVTQNRMFFKQGDQSVMFTRQ